LKVYIINTDLFLLNNVIDLHNELGSGTEINAWVSLGLFFNTGTKIRKAKEEK